jgi:hypothetical protein
VLQGVRYKKEEGTWAVVGEKENSLAQEEKLAWRSGLLSWAGCLGVGPMKQCFFSFTSNF